MTLPIICDWLDVTFSPNCDPYPDVNRLLLAADFDAEPSGTGGYAYRSGRAVVVYGLTRGAMRASFSGAACQLLRDAGLWEQTLSALGSVPHRVTRLDAALDLPVDGAEVVRAMRSRYPGGTVNLMRKAVPTSSVLEVRPGDCVETGTWYAGRMTKARYTARVYDKAWEALKKRGEVMRPTARFEVTAKGGDSGATLRDAAMPSALFWHIAAPALLDAPEGAPVWEPNQDLGWVAPVRDFDTAALLRRRVETFAQLDALASLADDLGPMGRDYLLSLLERRVRSPESRSLDQTA